MKLLNLRKELRKFPWGGKFNNITKIVGQAYLF
jgi:hypothetical protein